MNHSNNEAVLGAQRRLPITWPASHPEGTDPAEWPADLRVRQWPEVRR